MTDRADMFHSRAAYEAASPHFTATHTAATAGELDAWVERETARRTSEGQRWVRTKTLHSGGKHEAEVVFEASTEGLTT